ncbi:42150_t:CDS:1, partial [Gigaspora margarita]
NKKIKKVIIKKYEPTKVFYCAFKQKKSSKFKTEFDMKFIEDIVLNFFPKAQNQSKQKYWNSSYVCYNPNSMNFKETNVKRVISSSFMKACKFYMYIQPHWDWFNPGYDDLKLEEYFDCVFLIDEDEKDVITFDKSVSKDIELELINIITINQLHDDKKIIYCPECSSLILRENYLLDLNTCEN